MNVHVDMHRGKLNHIQHPGLRMFAAFLARGFLARDNSTSCTTNIYHLLKCAKEGVSPAYNLGVMLARTLSYSVTHNYQGTPLVCGGIATLIHNYIKDDMHLDDFLGTPARGTSRLDENVLERMDILYKYAPGVNFYRYMTADGSLATTSLPRPEYFDRQRGMWKIPEPEQAPAGWEQQPDQAPEQEDEWQHNEWPAPGQDGWPHFHQ
jgi:hypothetical protein